MARTFLDLNLMTWEVYPSGGQHGFSQNPHLVFNCLSNRGEPPRYMDMAGDSASAQKVVCEASEPELLALLSGSTPLD